MGADLGGGDVEAGSAEHVEVIVLAVVAPPRGRAPALPSALAALPGAGGPGRQERPARLEPTVDAAQEGGLLAAGHVDDGVERHDRVERAGREIEGGHVGLDERRAGDLLPGQLQLPGGEVHARNRVPASASPAPQARSPGRARRPPAAGSAPSPPTRPGWRGRPRPCFASSARPYGRSLARLAVWGPIKVTPTLVQVQTTCSIFEEQQTKKTRRVFIRLLQKGNGLSLRCCLKQH